MRRLEFLKNTLWKGDLAVDIPTSQIRKAAEDAAIVAVKLDELHRLLVAAKSQMISVEWKKFRDSLNYCLKQSDQFKVKVNEVARKAGIPVDGTAHADDVYAILKKKGGK